MSSYLPTPKSKLPKNPPAPAPVPAEPVEASAVEESAPVPAAPKRTGLPDWAVGALSAAYIAGLVLAAYLVFSNVRNLFAGGVASVLIPDPTQAAGSTPGATAEPTLPVLAGPTPKPWNGVERVTILVMGLDERDTEKNGPSRTDTMMLASIDPVSKQVAVLSIPRDLFVEIPTFGFNKINMAYFNGEAYRYPGGGPQLAKETVENLIGIPIQYYAVVDFQAFVKVVDTIGGIDVDIPFDNMRIDPYGPEDSVLLFEGINHLKGSWALAYARDRHASATSTSGGSDFDRAARIQQVILAIRDKVLDPAVLPGLIGKWSELYSEIAGGLHTDLSPEEMFALAMVAKDVNRGNIRMSVIDNNYLRALETVGTDKSPESVLIPDYDRIRELRDTLFASGGPLGYQTPPPEGSLLDLAIQENARILILNGSGVSGIAASTKDYLVRRGFSEANIQVGNGEYIAATQVYDYTGMPHSIRFFIDLMRVQTYNFFSQVNFDSEVDMKIVLGADWVVPAG